MMSTSLTLSVLAGLGLGVGLLLILLSFSPPAQRTRSKRPRMPRIRQLLNEAGQQRLPTSAFLTAVVACAVVMFLVVFLITGTAPVAACFALFATGAPWVALRWQVTRRRRALMHLWPDVVDHLRSAVRLGLSLPEGIAELGRTGPQPMREPFAEFGADWRAGVPMESALHRLRERLADPVGDRLVLALQITRELGGSDLGGLLATLSDFQRDAARTRSELEARQSWTVNGAKLAVAAPWAVVLLLTTQPAAAEAYRSGAGVLVLTVGLAVSVICYQMMRRIGSLPQEERVLV